MRDSHYLIGIEEEQRKPAQDLLRSHGVAQIYGAVAAGKYGCTRVHLDLLDALESALAVLYQLQHQIEDKAYCVALASRIALDLLPPPSGARVRADGTLAARHTESLLSAEPELLGRALLNDYLQYLDFYRHHADPDKRVDGDERLLACTRAYFMLLYNSMRATVGDSQLRVEVLGRHFRGLDEEATETPCSDLLDVSTEDVVGNDEFLKAGMRLARDVAGFDLESWQNPKRINPVLFGMGEPGCGKTVSCHAIGNYFLKYCREREVAASFVIIRRTDWASSYQNASAQQLIDIFKTRVAGFEGVVGVYWPDIDTAFAAREDSGLKSEEKNILGACFGIFDGTIIPKNGQWFMLCDANTLNMDRATISRITQDPFRLLGPITPHQYIHLLRNIKLGICQPFVDVTAAQWDELAKKCVDCKLSGRALENISRKVITEIQDFEYPDEYFKADLARRKEIIAQCSRHISYDRLCQIVDHYVAFEKEAEEKARRSQFEERVREIVLNTSAHAAAMQIGQD